MFSMASARFSRIPRQNLLQSTPISPNSGIQMFGIVETLTKSAAILNKLVQKFCEGSVISQMLRISSLIMRHFLLM